MGGSIVFFTSVWRKSIREHIRIKDHLIRWRMNKVNNVSLKGGWAGQLPLNVSLCSKKSMKYKLTLRVQLIQTKKETCNMALTTHL